MTLPIASVAFTVSLEPLLQDNGVPLAIMGMLVVFSALVVLIIVINLLARAVRAMEAKAKALADLAKEEPLAIRSRGSVAEPEPDQTAANPAAASSPGLAPAPAQAAADGQDAVAIPPEILAVIAAAAAEMEGGPVRVVRTRPLSATELAWTLEGRIRHHASHRIQTNRR